METYADLQAILNFINFWVASKERKILTKRKEMWLFVEDQLKWFATLNQVSISHNENPIVVNDCF